MLHLGKYPGLLSQIIPGDQSFDDNGYAGIFHFRFWQGRKWIDIFIDDRLPTVQGKLLYGSSYYQEEFGPSLFEKAYAKLYSSYAALSAGQVAQSFSNFSPESLPELYYLNEIKNRNFSTIILNAFKQNLMICCDTAAYYYYKSSYQLKNNETKLKNGLLLNHAYAVTGVRTLLGCNGKKLLLRIKDTNGPGTENRKGTWGVSSKYNLKSNTGEFWMTFKDFIEEFPRVTICQRLRNHENLKKWEFKKIEDRWVRGISAGGRYDSLDFFSNPQYCLNIEKFKEKKNNIGKTIISVRYKCERDDLSRQKFNCHINFVIFSMNDQREPVIYMDSDHLKNYPGKFEASYQLHLLPGTYCVIPSGPSFNESAEFTLEISSEYQYSLEKLDYDENFCVPSKRVRDHLTFNYNRKNTTKLFNVFSKGEKMINKNGLLALLELRIPQPGNFIENNGVSDLRDIIEKRRENMCQSIFEMFSIVDSEKLDFNQFEVLIEFIESCKAAFNVFELRTPCDDDAGEFELPEDLKMHSDWFAKEKFEFCEKYYPCGCINAVDLREALKSNGFVLSIDSLEHLAKQFTTTSECCIIDYNSYIMCVIHAHIKIGI